MKTFNIGDRIRVKEYNKIPEESRTKATGRLCGKIGTITDKLFSNSLRDFVYTIKFDEFNEESKKMWSADMLDAYSATIENYDFKFSAEGKKLTLTIYKDGKEIGNGWSFIHYYGEYGVVQAASYALGVIASKMKEDAMHLATEDKE